MSSDPVDRPASAPSRSLPARFAATVVGICLLAGLLSWLMGESLYKVVRPPLREVQAMGVTMMLPKLEDEIAADTKNAAIGYAALGACLGLFLGAIGGWAGGSVSRALFATGLGAILAAAAAALMSFAVVPIYFDRYDPAEPDLTLPLLTHGAIWGAIGAVGGLVFGLGLGGRNRALQAMLGGLLGGLAGAGVYEVVGAGLLPFAKTIQPVAVAWTARMLAHVSVAVLVGLCASLSVGERRKRSAK